MQMMPLENYVDAPQIAKERCHASALMAKYGWKGIDITGKRAEDVAREILGLLRADAHLHYF
jgi:regulator of PEP synthase PpsR (kinase-PPPase family)